MDTDRLPVDMCAFETKLGWFGLARNAGGVCTSVLFEQSPTSVLERLHLEWPDGLVVNPGAMPALVGLVKAYADGQPVSFDDCVLDLSSCTPFHRRVYEMVRTVDWGQVVSYGDVARAVDKPLAARAVGQAMARNPVPLIIPCHRVIASDGSIGGFGGGDSVSLKRRMLGLEGRAFGGR